MGCKSRLGFNGTWPKVNKAWSIHNESNRQVLAQYDEWFEQESVTDNVTKGWMIPLKQKRDITNSIEILKQTLKQHCVTNDHSLTDKTMISYKEQHCRKIKSYPIIMKFMSLYNFDGLVQDCSISMGDTAVLH